MDYFGLGVKPWSFNSKRRLQTLHQMLPTYGQSFFSFVSKLQRQGGDLATVETDSRHRRWSRARRRSSRVADRASALHHRREFAQDSYVPAGADEVLPGDSQAISGQEMRH